MKYEDILEVNKLIKRTNIKGKQYAEVADRVQAFRRLYPNGTISTDIEYLEDGMCVIKATVYDENEHILATGHALEREGSSQINSSSHLENCETSAVGRAIGYLGIGSETSIASAQEVEQAIAQQEELMKQKAHIIREIRTFIKERGLDEAGICAKTKDKRIKKLEDMEYSRIVNLSNWLVESNNDSQSR